MSISSAAITTITKCLDVKITTKYYKVTIIKNISKFLIDFYNLSKKLEVIFFVARTDGQIYPSCRVAALLTNAFCPPEMQHLFILD